MQQFRESGKPSAHQAVSKIAQTWSTRRAVRVDQKLPLRGQARRTPCCSPGTVVIKTEEAGFTVTTSLECLQIMWRFFTGCGEPDSIVTSTAVLTW